MSSTFQFSHYLMRRYFVGLLVFELLLVVLHFSFGHLRFFNLDLEYNLPSWFSGMQLAAIGVICIVTYHNEPENQSWPWAWFILASGFLYLSFDEIMVVHEGFFRQEALELIPGTSLLRGVPPWQVVFAPFIVVTSIIFALFFKSRFIPKSIAWFLLIGGFAFWGLAFILEGTAMSFFIPNGWYQQEVALEEFSEMVGATLILFAIVQYSFQIDPENDRLKIKDSHKKSLYWAMPILLLIVLPMGLIMLLNSYEKQNLHLSSAKRLLNDEKYTEAVDVLALALESDGENLEIIKLLAVAAYQSEDFALAERTYFHAFSIDPEDKVVRNGLSLLKLQKKLSKTSQE